MSYNSLFGLGTHSADADLEGWWKLDETSGTTISDSSGNGNNGTLQGGRTAADLTSASISPYLTSSLDFNGTSDYIDLPINFTAYPYSLGARVRWDGSGEDFIFSQGYSANTAVYYAITTRSGFYNVNVRNTTNRRAAGTTATGGVNHVVGVFDGDNSQQLWVDGVNEATQTVTTTQNSSVDQLAIGALLRSTDSNHFPGPISDAWAFSRSLSSSEIAEADAGPEPLNLTAPTVSGTHESGQTITSTDGTWDSQANGTLTYSYQWQTATDASGTGLADISGATSSSYTLTASEVGLYVRCLVASSNDGGNDSSEDTGSAWTLVTSGGPGPTFQPAWAMNATVIIQ